jgi:hypothetical protein
MNVLSRRTNRVVYRIDKGERGISRRPARLVSRLALALTTVSALLIAPMFLSAAGAAGPSVTVIPSTGLTDGQTVMVNGTGFSSGQDVFITECSSDILNEPQPVSLAEAFAKCGGVQDIQNPDANGNFTAFFSVANQFVTFAGGTVSCASPGACAVTASFFGTGTNLFFYGQPISFGASAPTPDTVTLSPADAVNTVGTSHTVTAAATSGGQPVSGSSIVFNVSGSTTTSGTCTTDTNGQCSFTYQGPQLPGADVIAGCADNNHNGTADAGEPCGTATKAWTLPTSTAGQTTGGGQIWNASHTDKIAFGFTAKSTSTGVKGECSVVDPSTNTKVKCTDATALVQSTTHATFFGNATVNGVATTYRIDVDDLGEPGAGRDTFTIQTTIGYTAGGVLANGNIQVHQ